MKVTPNESTTALPGTPPRVPPAAPRRSGPAPGARCPWSPSAATGMSKTVEQYEAAALGP